MCWPMYKTFLIKSLSLTVAYLTCFNLTSVHAEARYDIQDLGVLEVGASSEALKINERGEVLAASRLQRTTTPFLWSSGSAIVLVAPTGARTPIARGFTSDGLIVGSAIAEDNGQRIPVTWHDGQPVLHREILSQLGASYAQFSAANDAGMIIGSYGKISGYAERGFLFYNGVAKDLGSLFSAGDLEPLAINSIGQILCLAAEYDANDEVVSTRLVVWANDQLKPLSASTQFLDATGVALNTSGTVAANGLLETATEYLDRAIIIQGTNAFQLSTLGGANSLVNGLNDTGQAVGSAESTTLLKGTFDRAVLWSQGMVFDLNEVIDPAAGWLLVSASAINSCGQIAGVGYLQGARRAFRLSPAGVSSCVDTPESNPGTSPLPSGPATGPSALSKYLLQVATRWSAKRGQLIIELGIVDSAGNAPRLDELTKCNIILEGVSAAVRKVTLGQFDVRASQTTLEASGLRGLRHSRGKKGKDQGQVAIVASLQCEGQAPEAASGSFVNATSKNKKGLAALPWLKQLKRALGKGDYSAN